MFYVLTLLVMFCYVPKFTSLLLHRLFLVVGFLLIVGSSCKKEEEIPIPPINPNPSITEIDFIKGADVSRLPEIELHNIRFYNKEMQEEAFLDILKKSDINTLRMRLWVNPENGHSGFDEVQAFAQRARQKGFKIWLCLHYSDTWAHPGQQIIPKEWASLSFDSLKETMKRYTKRVVLEIPNDFIQIGNEINDGFLFPHGSLVKESAQFKTLLQSAVEVVRTQKPSTKIIVHFAGIKASDWFFNQIKDIDFDVIGLSFYPIWHGKNLDSLANQMQFLSETFQKKIVIAETAYPFTLEWNDQTHNVVGLEDQLILPDFPATPEGQHNFIAAIMERTKAVEKGFGICYWGGELVAWKGSHAYDASSWENQAFFDFNNRVLPVLSVFE